MTDSVGWIVGAIDFGSAASAGAVALRKKEADASTAAGIAIVPLTCDPHSVKKIISSTPKVATILLLDAWHMKAVDYGPEALARYFAEGLDEDGNTNGKFLLLENFKMQLLGKKLPSNIHAKCGRPVPIHVAIRELLSVARQSIMRYVQKTLEKVDESDFSWYLTYPTQWEPAATTLMIEAAKAAGMKRVDLVPESEAAAIKCRHDQLHPQTAASTSADTPAAEAYDRDVKSGDHKSAPASDSAQTAQTAQTAQKAQSAQAPAQSAQAMAVGRKAIVMDGGGGTFDITICEIGAEGRLSKVEWHGGAWGSRLIDASIMRVLDGVFGAMFMYKYSKARPKDYADLVESCQTLKHSFGQDDQNDGKSDYRLPLPLSFLLDTKLAEIGKKPHATKLSLSADPHGIRPNVAVADPPQPKSKPASWARLFATEDRDAQDAKDAKSAADIKDASKKTEDDSVVITGCKMSVLAPTTLVDDCEYVGYSPGVLRFSHGLVRRLMFEVIRPITDHVRSLQTGGVLSVCAVGGFCENAWLRDELQKCFPDRPITVPVNPTLAVLQGAILFGLDPQLISSRVMTRYYGIDSCVRWDSSDHYIVNRECTMDAKSHPTKVICHNHFNVLVKRGQTVSPTKQFTIVKRPIKIDQEGMDVEVYCTDRIIDHQPVRLGPNETDLYRYIHRIGRITVWFNPPDPHGDDPLGVKRAVTIVLQFGIHISITATDEIGRPVKHDFQFPVDH